MIFSKGPKNEFETAVVNEPSVCEPLKFYSNIKSVFFVLAIQREEEKTKRHLKEAAKKGEKSACGILAKEIIHSRKAVNRLYASKAHMNSIAMNMKNQLGRFIK